jgi:hypothetical protein
MNPSLRNLFMTKLVQERVVPTTSVNVPSLILAMTISGSRSVPKWANNSSGRAGRCSLATAHAPTAYPWHCWIQVAR